MSKEDLVAIRVFMPSELRDTFKVLCTLKRSTMNQAIVDFVEEYVEQNKALLPKEKDSKAEVPENLKELIRRNYFDLMNSGQLKHNRLKELSFGQPATAQERKIISEVLQMPLENLPK